MNRLKSTFSRYSPHCTDLVIGLVLLLISELAHAIAGGAGGDSDSGSWSSGSWGSSDGWSSSGSDGSGGELIWVLLRSLFRAMASLPFPFNWISFVLFAVVIIYALRMMPIFHSITGRDVYHWPKKMRSLTDIATILASTASQQTPSALPAAFLKRNPNFTLEAFRAKVSTAFTSIQSAWSAQDLRSVRRWISDGIWQRFNVQIEMMRLLEQTNPISALIIRNIAIDAIEQDGHFDIIHVRILFSARDDFVSKRFPQLDQHGAIMMIEYWTFVRKSSGTEYDLYHNNLCPSCGNELPTDLGEVARCRNCRTITTLGDYDWVLSEITQADDYLNQSQKLAKSGRFTQNIRAALETDKDFSIQSIEDKAANAYLQILAANVTRRPERMRRFVSDTLFEQLSQQFEQSAPFVFNRLYLNSVTVIDGYSADDKDHLIVAIKRTAQRVDISGGALKKIDQHLHTVNEMLVFTRDSDAATTKASLYAHHCTACGAPTGDTLDIHCSYCNSLLNSTRYEWIVTGLYSSQAYEKWRAGILPAMTTKVAATDLDPLYLERDYAMNNIAMLIGCDGIITPGEREFFETASRRLKYDPKCLAGLLKLAPSRKLSLRLPEDRGSVQKVRKLMHQAALADGAIGAEEQALLAEVDARIAQMDASQDRVSALG